MLDAAYGIDCIDCECCCLILTGCFDTGGQTGCSGGKRPTGGFGSDGTGSGDSGDSYIARREMAPTMSEAA